MTDHFPIVIQIVSQPMYIAVVRSAVQTLAQKLGMSNEHSGHVILAIDEALTNVIRHGYGGRNDQPIWIRLKPLQIDDDKHGIEIVIDDESQGVDLDQIKGRPLDEIRPGGLGVHIIRQMMDKVSYTHREEVEGLRLRICKYFQPAPTASKRQPTATQVDKR